MPSALGTAGAAFGMRELGSGGAGTRTRGGSGGGGRRGGGGGAPAVVMTREHRAKSRNARASPVGEFGASAAATLLFALTFSLTLEECKMPFDSVLSGCSFSRLRHATNRRATVRTCTSHSRHHPMQGRRSPSPPDRFMCSLQILPLRASAPAAERVPPVRNARSIAPPENAPKPVRRARPARLNVRAADARKRAARGRRARSVALAASAFRSADPEQNAQKPALEAVVRDWRAKPVDTTGCTTLVCAQSERILARGGAAW